MKKSFLAYALVFAFCLVSASAFADLDSDTVDIFMKYAPGGPAKATRTISPSSSARYDGIDPTVSLIITLRNWDRLRPETRKLLSKYITVSDWKNGARTVSLEPSFTNCQTEVPESTNQTLDSTHFRAVFTTKPESSHKTTTGFVQSMLTEAEKAWTKEITTIGMPPPLLPSDNKIRIFICDLYGGATASQQGGILGRTWTDKEYSDFTASTLIEMDNDYANVPLGGVSAAEYAGVVFAHEFFHTIQFGINWYSPTSWLLESTATWVEEEVYPDSNDYITAYTNTRLAGLSISIDSLAGTNFAYGSNIFFRHITENVADRGFMPKMWSDLKTTCILGPQAPTTWCNPYVTETPLISSVLASNYSSNIQDTYRSFNVANYLKTYVDGSLPSFVGVSPSPLNLSNNAVSAASSLNHLSAHFYKITYPVNSGLAVPTLYFSGSNASNTNWGLTTVLQTPAGAKTVEHKTLSSGAYTGQLAGLGTTYNSVVIIVNNTDISDDNATYSLNFMGSATVVLSNPGVALNDQTISNLASDAPAHIAQIISAKDGKITGVEYTNTGTVSTTKQLIWKLYKDANNNGKVDTGEAPLGTKSTLGSTSVIFSDADLNDADSQITSGQAYTFLLSVSSQTAQVASRKTNAAGAIAALALACGLAIPLRKKRGVSLILLAALIAIPLIYSGCGGGGGAAPAPAQTLKLSLFPEDITIVDSQGAAISLDGNEVTGPTLTFQ